MQLEDATILAALEDAGGGVSAERVVEAARDPEHPWHARFVWDDAVAGEKYRLQQARALIRSVVYERRIERTVTRSVRYIRDPDAMAHEQRYVSVIALRADEERARSALILEYARAAALLRRTRALAEVLGQNHRVAEIVDALDNLSELLRAPALEAPAATM